MATQLRQTWNLDLFFEGGSSSPALRDHLEALERAFADLQAHVEATSAAAEAADQWHGMFDLLQRVQRQLEQASSFVGCLTAQDVRDEQAKLLMSRIIETYAQLEQVTNLLDARILEVPESDWERLLSDPRIEPLAFNLRERRVRAREKMSPALENVVTDLSVDGYHAWGTLYDTLVGRITIPFEKDGEVEKLYVGQAFNKFSDPDRDVRARLFVNWEKSWGEQAELIAACLNHLSGFRLNLYRQRGWDSVLKEPLEMNRMSEATLNAMWEAVSTAKPKLKAYLQRKAALLGCDVLNWYDLEAPLNKTTRKVTYEEAADFIVEQFGRFSPQMADFAAHSFANQWIEVEDRAGKAPGGFCTAFPQSAESRIFMTFGGEANGVSTLAHELGHAYHSHVMFDMPTMTQNYAMNVAETASTFAELITTNAAIKAAGGLDERLALLDDKLGNAVAYLMNIHGRFLFETRFYEARHRGALSIDQLNEMMLTAQKEAYQDALGQYHPLFWASKGHFYGTGAPFYNFPYTFGFLFSAGIYARAEQEGPTFERRYVDLLRDTGRTTVEDLASRHLGVDLSKPEFWLTGVQLTLNDVDEYLRLTAK